MDGGVALTSRRHLPATQLLGIGIDNFASAETKKLTKADTLQQMAVFCGNKHDTNGRLLYPDGAPLLVTLLISIPSDIFLHVSKQSILPSAKSSRLDFSSSA